MDGEPISKKVLCVFIFYFFVGDWGTKKDAETEKEKKRKTKLIEKFEQQINSMHSSLSK